MNKANNIPSASDKKTKMSKKLRKRKERRNIDRSSSDVLSIQKQTMKKAFLDYLGAAIMFFVMALVVFVAGLLTEDAAHSKRIVFGATPIILGFTIFFAFLFLRRFIIYTKINKIKSMSEQTIEITCKKVSFLTQPISKHSAVIICIVLTDENGKKLEPMELAYVDVPDEFTGTVIDKLSQRKGEMLNMKPIAGGYTRLEFRIPSRGLIGFSTDFMTLTKGYGIMNHTFKEYLPYESNISVERKEGVLVSMENGKSTAYALGGLEDRGVMFIEPGTEVYEGMIVGECNRDNDLAINVVKGKNLTNVRAAGSDHTVVLKRPRPITLEYALDYINSDELVEVTPNHIRLRKRILNTEERKKFDSRKNN